MENNVIKIKAEKMCELEKFGYKEYFSQIESCGNGNYYKFVSPTCFVIINKYNRIIGKMRTHQRNEYFTMFYKYSALRKKDIIDLIKADMIEI